MKSVPFFSILIPTRNRPEILKLSLSSLLYQKFRDFQIIVSDNSDAANQKKNQAYINTLDASNVKYVKPPQLLNMHEHWEFGFGFATGEYQGVLIDKTLLKQNALLELHDVLKNESVDLINYLHGGIEYYPTKVFKFKRITKEEKKEENLVEYFSPADELVRRLNFEKNIRSDFSVNELKYYNFGKVSFGFYSHKLVRRIRSQYEKLFHPICCDYSSCALALHCAKRAIWYNRELLLAICNFKGNGCLCETKSGAMLDFLKTCDPSLEFFKELPIPHLYCALHNLCAYDYQILKRTGISSYSINFKNLVIRCAEDLVSFPYISDAEKQEQWELLVRFARKVGLTSLEDTKPVRGVIQTEGLTVKIYRFLFKKTVKQKVMAILKRIFFDLQFIRLKSLLKR